MTLPALLLGCNSDKTEKQKAEKAAEGQKLPQSSQNLKGSPASGEQKIDKSSSDNVNWMKEVEGLRAKGDLASLTTAREKLLTLTQAQSQDPQVYFQLGLTYYDQARRLDNPQREALEDLYQRAIENLENARNFFEEDKRPIQLYRALWESYRNLAYLPVTFNQGTDPDKGVVPLNMKHMKKAIEIYEEAKAKYPSDPAVAVEIGDKLSTDMKNLEAVYLANVQRQWDEMNESGYRKPETYQEKGHR